MIQLVCATVEELGPFPGWDLGLGLVCLPSSHTLGATGPKVLVVGTAGSLGDLESAKWFRESGPLPWVPRWAWLCPRQDRLCDPTLLGALDLPEMDVRPSDVRIPWWSIDSLTAGIVKWRPTEPPWHAEGKGALAAVYGYCRCGPDAHAQWLANVSGAAFLHASGSNIGLSSLRCGKLLAKTCLA